MRSETPVLIDLATDFDVRRVQQWREALRDAAVGRGELAESNHHIWNGLVCSRCGKRRDHTADSGGDCLQAQRGDTPEVGLWLQLRAWIDQKRMSAPSDATVYAFTEVLSKMDALVAHSPGVETPLAKDERGNMAVQLRELVANVRGWKRSGVDAIPSERELLLIHRASIALEHSAVGRGETPEPATFTPEFQERIDSAVRSCRRSESDGFHGDHERDPTSAKLIEDLASLLRDAYTQNAAWRKRADEAESALSAVGRGVETPPREDW